MNNDDVEYRLALMLKYYIIHVDKLATVTYRETIWLKPSSKSIFTDRSKAVLLLWIIFFVVVMLCCLFIATL